MNQAENSANPIYRSLGRTVSSLKKMFGNSADLSIAKLNVCGIGCAVVTLEGMVSSADLSVMLFEPLMSYRRRSLSKLCTLPEDIYAFLSRQGIFSTGKTEVYTLDDISDKICSGFAVILVDGLAKGVAITAQAFKTSSISEPDSEVNIKGTKEALTDSLRISMSLIRRRIKSPLLRFELIKAGTLSDIELAIVYIEGKTPERLREEVKKRLKAIKLELVLTSGSIMPFVSEDNGSFFSGASTTQRPDVLAAKINEGRLAVLIDGVPYAVVFPTLFTENFQSVDDYEEKPYFATFQRWVRYLAFFIAAFLPGVYVASATFHSEALSRQLLLSLIASEESTPLPLVTEMIMVIIMFEILREAGLRLPRAVGGAVSIVGGLVIGDAAVTSGLISAPLLIIIGITATSSFVVPGLNPQVTILRLLGVILGGMAGHFGIAVLIVVTLVNAGATDGFGVPYTAPLFPFTLRAMRDVATRVGFRRMQERTASIEKLNGSGGENAEQP